MARRRRAHRFQKSRKSIFDGFLEAAIFENCEDWEGDWTGQSRSSWPEVDFQDFRDSGELGDGPEKDLKGFWRIFEDFESNPSQPTVQNLDFLLKFFELFVFLTNSQWTPPRFEPKAVFSAF